MRKEKFGRLNESGQGMSEYLILMMLIAVGSIAATTQVGDVIVGKLTQIRKSISAVHIKDVN